MKLKYTHNDKVLVALGFRWLWGKKQTLLFTVAAALNLCTQAQAQVGRDNDGAPLPCTLDIYYWPNFHPDPFHQSKKDQGWTKWEIVKHAKPLFDGHYQPKVPLTLKTSVKITAREK